MAHVHVATSKSCSASEHSGLDDPSRSQPKSKYASSGYYAVLGVEYEIRSRERALDQIFSTQVPRIFTSQSEMGLAPTFFTGDGC